MRRAIKEPEKRRSLKKITFFSMGLFTAFFSYIAVNTLVTSEDILYLKRKQSETKVSSVVKRDRIEIKKEKQEKIRKKLKIKTVLKTEDKPIRRKKRIKKGKKSKNKKKRDTLIIGDSIAYGMSLSNTYTGVDKVNDYYWITEGGISINFIPENLQLILGKVMPKSTNNTLSSSAAIDLVKEIKEKGIKNVVIFLGINGSGKKNAEKTVERMLAIKEKTGCNVFYIATLPVVDWKARQYGYQVVDSLNETFNQSVEEHMKEQDLIYVDAYQEVKNFSEYTKYTQDGIHYGSQVYNKVIEKLEEEIRRMNERNK